MVCRLAASVGLGAVEGEGQQLIVPGGVYDLEAKMSGEGLVREPRPLFYRSQHTHAGPALGQRVGNAVFHQCAAVAAVSLVPQDPQTVYVEVFVPDHRYPGGFQGGILNEHGGPLVQFSEHVALRQALREPLPLGLHPRVALVAANDAAEVFVGQIFRRQVEEIPAHDVCLLTGEWMEHL